MSSIKVSVCISVHNTAKYLPRCLDSVLAQTLPNLEIVLVNNGSSDESELIMRQYQTDFPNRNIQVISQDDKGLAQGRQTGINNANGDFITFLDADDYIKPTAYEELYENAIQNDADISEMETVRDNVVISSPYKGVMESEDVLKNYFEYANIPTMLWLRLYRKTLFSKPVFPSLYTNNEDNFALPCLLYNAEKICYIKKVFHFYSTDNEEAVMTTFARDKKNKKFYENRKKTLYIVPHVESYIGKEKIEKKMKREFNQFKFRIITEFFYSDTAGISYSKKMQDVLHVFHEETKKTIEVFLKKTAGKDCITNKLIRVLGFKTVYYIHKIKKNWRV